VAETNLVCFTAEVDAELLLNPSDSPGSPSLQRSPPPQYPASEASASSAFRPPPSFSSLFAAAGQQGAASSILEPCEPYKPSVADADEADPTTAAAPAYAPANQVAPESSSSASAALRLQDETKRALPHDTKGHTGEPSRSAKDEEAEPPPAYSEGSSPLQSFTYLMAAAGGASSIITQVQQGGPSLNPLGGMQPQRREITSSLSD
jgi:G patch domain-containing protein 1